MIRIKNKVSKNKIRNENFKFNLRYLTLSLAIMGCAANAQALTTYKMTEINGVIAGAVINVTPTALNTVGLVIGKNSNPLNVYPVLYNPTSGSLTKIQTLIGGYLLTETDINQNGQVVGAGQTIAGAPVHAFVRNNDGSGTDLGTVLGDATSRVYAVNDSGQIVGISTPSSATPCTVHAFVGNLNAPGLLDFGSLGGKRNYAYDINDNGQIVGKSSTNPLSDCLATGSYHAYISSDNGLIDLHQPNMLGTNSSAYKINDLGFVAGEFANGLTTTGISSTYLNGYPIYHAVIWNTAAGTFKDLGAGSKDSSLRSINAAGVAVGFERTYSTANFSSVPVILSQNAVIADANSTGLTDLNTLVILPTGWVLTTASDINDAGQVIASAKDAAGGLHGVLLTPTSIAVTPPNAPSNLLSSPISSTQVDLSWTDNATNETSQYLERCQGAGCTNFAQIAMLAAGATAYSDSALAPTTSYSYRIRAHGTTGDSSYSNVTTVSTLSPAVTLLAPSNLINVATSRRYIILNWKDNSDNEQNFLLERCAGLNCTNFTQIARLAANVKSYTNSGLTRNSYYSYRVIAANSFGKSEYSNILSVKTSD